MMRTAWVIAMTGILFTTFGANTSLFADEPEATFAATDYAREVVVSVLQDRGLTEVEARSEVSKMTETEIHWYAQKPGRLQVARGLRLDEMVGGAAMMLIAFGGTYAIWKSRVDYRDN